jgi:hypothetical protein
MDLSERDGLQMLRVEVASILPPLNGQQLKRIVCQLLASANCSTDARMTINGEDLTSIPS